ncbi:MAG: hypothetical protein II722_00250 [Ruminococcus sp.]|nr:hypothetical protein [Ruminococcus sp.]
MPKSYKDMKKEVYAKMKEFERAGDFQGLAHYMVSTAEMYIEDHETNPTEDIEKSNMSLFSKAVESYLEEMALDDDRDGHLFDIRKHVCAEVVNARIALGKKMDEVEHDMKLGMIKGTELLADEPKMMSKISSAVALKLSKKVLWKARAADEMLISVADKFDIATDKQKYRADLEELATGNFQKQYFRDAWNSHNELDENTKQKYQDYATVALTITDEKPYTFEMNDTSDPDKLIKEVPNSISLIKECKSFDELEALKQRIQSDKQKRIDYKNNRLAESKRSRELLEELKSKNIDPPSKEYNELCEVLEEFGKLGNGMRHLRIDDGKFVYDDHEPVSNDIKRFTIEMTFDCIKERCKNFAEKHPDHSGLSATIKDFATQGKKDLEDELEEISTARSKYDDGFSLFDVKQYDYIIKRIDVAEQRMFMNTEKPTQRYNSIKNFYNATDDVYFGLLPLLDKITKDNEQREANKEGLSGTYIDFVDAAKKVKADYNFRKNTGGNINTTMAKKFAENLEELMKAANAYTKDHTGITNMHKATHGVGAERLEWSKAFGEKIGRALPGYKETVSKLPKLGGGTYGTELTQIETNLMNDKEAAIRKISLAKELGPRINAAYDKVNETYTQQLKPEQECPEGVSKEDFFAQQKALVIDYAAKVLAVNLSGKQLKNLQPNYKNMRDNEINQLNTETLSEQGVANTAESIKTRDDWKQMTKNLTTWDDINRIKNLAAQNKGAGLVADLNRCDRILNQNAANAVNNAAQAKIQAKQELEGKGFVVM